MNFFSVRGRGYVFSWDLGEWAMKFKKMFDVVGHDFHHDINEWAVILLLCSQLWQFIYSNFSRFARKHVTQFLKLYYSGVLYNRGDE